MSPVRFHRSILTAGIMGEEKFYFSWRAEALWYEPVTVGGHLALVNRNLTWE